ncbi:MAG: archaellin/type IV pilin N-terminal domain-containing protein [Sulfolobales archaeon]
MRSVRKAVSPLIATIILIAVTLTVAVIVIAWIYGIFGTTAGPTEKLKIFQDARLVVNQTGNYVNFSVTIKNEGTTIVTFNRVYIKELPSCSTTSPTDIKLSGGKTQLPSGDDGTLTVQFTNCQVQPGITYNVVILTNAGNAYTVPVTAELGG